TLSHFPTARHGGAANQTGAFSCALAATFKAPATPGPHAATSALALAAPRVPALLSAAIAAGAKPQSLSAASPPAPRACPGAPISGTVREKRGAGAGCSTPSRRTKVLRAALWGWC